MTINSRICETQYEKNALCIIKPAIVLEGPGYSKNWISVYGNACFRVSVEYVIQEVVHYNCTQNVFYSIVPDKYDYNGERVKS